VQSVQSVQSVSVKSGADGSWAALRRPQRRCCAGCPGHQGCRCLKPASAAAAEAATTLQTSVQALVRALPLLSKTLPERKQDRQHCPAIKAQLVLSLRPPDHAETLSELGGSRPTYACIRGPGGGVAPLRQRPTHTGANARVGLSSAAAGPRVQRVRRVGAPRCRVAGCWPPTILHRQN
jgi:hypothetical protein